MDKTNTNNKQDELNRIVFYTINPHEINPNLYSLIDKIDIAKKRYYRKKLGARYYKKKDEQFQFGIFTEYGKVAEIEKHTHFHFLIFINENKVKECMDFCKFITDYIRPHYFLVTDKIELVKNTVKDINKVWSYVNKENNPILTDKDFFKKLEYMSSYVGK